MDEVRDATQPGCVTKARELLIRARSFVWRPVILVLHESGQNGHRVHGQLADWIGAKVAVRFRRCELANKIPRTGKDAPLEAFVERPHLLDIPEAEREPADVPFGISRDVLLPNAGMMRQQGADIVAFWNDDAIVLPYTDATWAALLRLQDTLLRAGEALAALLQDPKQLEAQGGSIYALGPGPAPKEPD